MKKLLVLVVLGLIAASCASSSDSSDEQTTTSAARSETTATSPTTTTTPPPPPPIVVFTVQEDGGCMMAGPNCAEYRFYNDGTVEVYRIGTEVTTPEAAGTIDETFVASVQDALDGADLASLYDSLAPGECRGCYDGIDTTFTYDVPGTVTIFASTDVELDASIPLFAATWSAVEEAQLTLGQLEPEMRTG